MTQIAILLEYNFWANDLFISRLKSIESALINKQLSHIFSAHELWLNRISGIKDVPSLWEISSSEEWEARNLNLFHKSKDIIQSMALNTAISYSTIHGEHYTNTLKEIFHHLVNHGTHHRGQIIPLMKDLNILPPQSDYIYYLRLHSKEL